MSDDPLDNIRKHLQTLKLRQMAMHLDEQLAMAEQQNASTALVLERLLEIEAVSLIERRIERRIKESKLPERKLLVGFDFAFQPGLDEKQIMDLATLGFVERKQWLILAGSSGTGNYVKFLLM